MKKRLALVIAVVALIAFPSFVTATDNEKVFVCKYVGTPSDDERLQTGNNPISVSINAIPDFQGIGSYFADAQGRSFVLAYDTGQDEPDVSECPGFVAPTPEPTPEQATSTPTLPTEATPTPEDNTVGGSGKETLPPTDTEDAASQSNMGLALVLLLLAMGASTFVILSPRFFKR